MLELAQIAMALRDLRVRNAILAVTETEYADAAEQVCAWLSRVLASSDRVQAASLLCLYARRRPTGGNRLGLRADR